MQEQDIQELAELYNKYIQVRDFSKHIANVLEPVSYDITGIGTAAERNGKAHDAIISTFDSNLAELKHKMKYILNRYL